MKTPISTFLLVALGVLGAGAAGCGGEGAEATPASATASATAAPAPAATAAPAASSAAPAAPAGPTVAEVFQGEPKDDIKAYKGWVNRTYDYGFRIPTGWTSASLPGGGFLMHDAEQKAIIALDYVGSAELTHASLETKSKMAPFLATELKEVTPPTMVEVGSKKFLAKAGLSQGKLGGTQAQLYWMDLAGIQTHEGERGPYHFIVMVGLKEGVSDAAKSQALSAIRSMTPMSGQPYFTR
jgi:hypothetical protein